MIQKKDSRNEQLVAIIRSLKKKVLLANDCYLEQLKKRYEKQIEILFEEALFQVEVKGCEGTHSPLVLDITKPKEKIFSKDLFYRTVQRFIPQQQHYRIVTPGDLTKKDNVRFWQKYLAGKDRVVDSFIGVLVGKFEGKITGEGDVFHQYYFKDHCTQAVVSLISKQTKGLVDSEDKPLAKNTLYFVTTLLVSYYRKKEEFCLFLPEKWTNQAIFAVESVEKDFFLVDSWSSLG